MTTSQVLMLSRDTANHFAILKKKTDVELLKLYESASNICLYYENADSFEQSSFEASARRHAYQDKQEIKDFINRFRPALKGMV